MTTLMGVHFPLDQLVELPPAPFVERSSIQYLKPTSCVVLQHIAASTDASDSLAEIWQEQLASASVGIYVNVPDPSVVAGRPDPPNRHRHVPTSELFLEDAARVPVEHAGLLDHRDLLSCGIDDADEMVRIGQWRGANNADGRVDPVARDRHRHRPVRFAMHPDPTGICRDAHAHAGASPAAITERVSACVVTNV